MSHFCMGSKEKEDSNKFENGLLNETTSLFLLMTCEPCEFTTEPRNHNSILWSTALSFQKNTRQNLQLFMSYEDRDSWIYYYVVH
jgi:hypothetical protein